jgi:hypothetical protein
VNWVEYTEAAQRLAEVQRGDERRRAALDERTAGMRASAEQLKRRLGVQRDKLIRIAVALRLPEPALGEVPRGGLTDPDEAARRALVEIDRAEEAANQAERLGYQPFLPGVAPAVRNGVIYAATTAACAVVSVAMVLFGARGADRQIPTWTMPWALCGLPAVAFFAGYFIIVNFARPRIRAEPVRGAPPARKGTRREGTASVRLGGLICLIGTWLAWAVAVTTNLG